MTRRACALVAAIAVGVASLSNIAAAASYTGPWDAAADAAAERSVARLGEKRGLEIRVSVTTIPMLLQGSGVHN